MTQTETRRPESEEEQEFNQGDIVRIEVPTTRIDTNHTYGVVVRRLSPNYRPQDPHSEPTPAYVVLSYEDGRPSENRIDLASQPIAPATTEHLAGYLRRISASFQPELVEGLDGALAARTQHNVDGIVAFVEGASERRMKGFGQFKPSEPETEIYVVSGHYSGCFLTSHHRFAAKITPRQPEAIVARFFKALFPDGVGQLVPETSRELPETSSGTLMGYDVVHIPQRGIPLVGETLNYRLTGPGISRPQ